MEIAKTILSQIQTLDKWALVAYGATEFIAIKKSNFHDNSLGGLKFKVKGFNHKGFVEISLNHRDLYDIVFYTVRKNPNQFTYKTSIKNVIKDVYVDSLITSLDFIEDKKSISNIN